MVSDGFHVPNSVWGEPPMESWEPLCETGPQREGGRPFLRCLFVGEAAVRFGGRVVCTYLLAPGNYWGGREGPFSLCMWV